MEIQQPIPICDLHCDTPGEILAGKKLLDRSCEVNLPDMLSGNVAIQIFANYLSPNIPGDRRFATISKMITTFKQELAAYPEQIGLCTSSIEIKRCLSQGKIAAILSIENGMAIESDLDKLQQFYDAGVRCLTIIHSVSSDWAISCNDRSPAFDGLTPFGEQVIKKMNQLGMVIDISHAHETTVEKVLKISSLPVIASHSCAAALCPIPRNLTDAQLEKIASRGGMVGINFFPAFLDYDYYQKSLSRCGDIFDKLDEMEKQAGADAAALSRIFAAFRAEFKEKMADTRIPLARIFDHIDHIVKLVGEDHVGFGSDFDGVAALPEKMESCAAFALMKQEFAARNYSKQAIEKICYKNFLTLFEQVCG